MNRSLIKTCGAGLFALAATFGMPAAYAQTTLSPEVTAAIASGAPPPNSLPDSTEVMHGGAGASYISGGAGASERAAMERKRRQFPLKLVLSAKGGEYIVADTVTLRSTRGMLTAQQVGPLMMIKAPPGRYMVEVNYNGKTRRQSIQVGSQPREVNFSFNG